MLVGPGATLGAGAAGRGTAPGDLTDWSTRMGFAEGGARVGAGRAAGIDAVDAGSKRRRDVSTG